jgi:uncharacterized RDD family membrane protein YckC
MNYDIQRAGLSRRLPAWLLDIILLVTLATGLMAGLSYVVDMDTHQKALDDVYVRYEQEFGIDFDITPEQFEAMTEEEIAKYDAAAEALSKDTQAQKTYEMLLNLTLITLSGGILGAFLILEFAIPLILKNGQTLGKKVFGVALMRKDGIKVTPFMMFVRTILGKFTLETMIPVLLVVAVMFGIVGIEGFLGIVVILLLQVVVGLVTRNKTGIHDLMACTVAVDLSSQMIFDSVDAQLEYYKRLHAENAAQADY